jgi:hypothetical protein
MFKLIFQKQIIGFILCSLFISVFSDLDTHVHLKNSNGNNKFVLLEDRDLSLFEIEDSNNYMELKDTPNKKRARAFAVKWAATNQKSTNFKPFHVKASEEKVPNWKNYLVLLTGPRDNYLLKKVCFSSENLNFGIVLDSNKSCNHEVYLLFN